MKKIDDGYMVDLGECKVETVNLEGVISPELLRKLQEERDAIQWCDCEDSSDAYYVDDTKEMKHHWRCRKCHKVVQIG